MKSSASESKAFQSRSKGEIPARARRKERLSRSKLKQAFLIDSDAELLISYSDLLLSTRKSSEGLLAFSFREVLPAMTYTERVGSSLRSRGRKGIGKKWLREGGVRAFLPVSLSLLPVSLGIPLSGAKTEIACGEMKTK